MRNWLRIVIGLCAGAAAWGSEWKTYEGVQWIDSQYYDGDSFWLRVPEARGRWEIRLYGVDCPETDARYPERLAEQRAAFGLDSDEAVLAWGERCREFVKRVMWGRELRLHVTVPKEKTRRGEGQGQRYFGIVEVRDKSGEWRRLDSWLAEEGMARSFGQVAAWPLTVVERDGKEEARQLFRRDLDRLEARARKAGAGIWGAKAGRDGR
jgi:endonuclease YncB( thermonuclease family)